MAVFDAIRLNSNDPCGENWVLTAEKNRYSVEINKALANRGHKICGTQLQPVGATVEVIAVEKNG